MTHAEFDREIQPLEGGLRADLSEFQKGAYWRLLRGFNAASLARAVTAWIESPEGQQGRFPPAGALKARCESTESASSSRIEFIKCDCGCKASFSIRNHARELDMTLFQSHLTMVARARMYAAYGEDETKWPSSMDQMRAAVAKVATDKERARHERNEKRRQELKLQAADIMATMTPTPPLSDDEIPF
jgi:hypothetical protein